MRVQDQIISSTRVFTKTKDNKMNDLKKILENATLASEGKVVTLPNTSKRNKELQNNLVSDLSCNNPHNVERDSITVLLEQSRKIANLLISNKKTLELQKTQLATLLNEISNTEDSINRYASLKSVMLTGVAGAEEIGHLAIPKTITVKTNKTKRKVAKK